MRRRDLLAGLGLASVSLAAGQRVSVSAAQAEIPITGEAGAGLEAIDQKVVEVMRRHRIPGVSLSVAKDGKLVLAHELEPFRALPGGRPPMMQAAGGWGAPTVEMARFLVELSGRRGPGFLSPPVFAQMIAPPPPPFVKKPKGGDFGLGWDAVFATPKGPVFRKGGALDGIHTVIEHRANGLDWALFVNASVEVQARTGKTDAPPMWADLQQQVRSALNAVTAWPTVDLFPKFA